MAPLNLVTIWKKEHTTQPTEYNGKLENGRMFVVLFRWEQFRVWISKRKSNNYKAARFGNGDLILSKIIKPNHRALFDEELSEEYIIKELTKIGFDFSKIK
jgi:hypothetical protein